MTDGYFMFPSKCGSGGLTDRPSLRKSGRKKPSSFFARNNTEQTPVGSEEGLSLSLSLFLSLRLSKDKAADVAVAKQ